MKELVMETNPTVYENIMKYLEPKIGKFEDLSIEEKITVINKLERSCKSCDLHYETPYQNIPSVLNKESKFLFIGRNPNGTEAQSNKLYPEGTRQGEIFRKYLSLLGLGLGEVSIVNMCQCYGRKNRPITSEEINKCLPFKEMELQCLPNLRMIFAMGQDALKYLYGNNHPGALQCTGDVYQSQYKGHIILIACLLHPSHILMDKELSKEMSRILKALNPLVQEVKAQNN